jgi:hypothetical protein
MSSSDVLVELSDSKIGGHDLSVCAGFAGGGGMNDLALLDD